MKHAAAVSIVSYDVASRVDPIRIRLNGPRYIDGSKSTLAQQKTMSVAAAVKIQTHDFASRVDSIRSRKRSPRDVDRV